MALMRLFFSLLSLCVAAACASSPQSHSQVASQVAAPAATPVALTQEKASPIAERRLIKTVTLELRVPDTVRTSGNLQKLVVELGGHVASMTADRRDGVLVYDVARPGKPAR